ncbi:MAG: DUF3604 domain-containing protein [Betaproteobacteria bacterium]|nr:MAG: DUF3604 domain-containing protein [Betaproteobacteria bacterium]TMH90507.1 MAG: DUF3604 domain-containing protein [Betaproteobacteria bacterium]
MYQRHASVRNNAFHSTYLADRVGRAVITPTGEFEAGSFASITLTYTAGYFGIDDTGSLKIVQRFASDAGRPQFNDPKGWNYVTAEASNGAVLELRYEQKGNIRPWDRTLLIRVQRGFLREGDTITVRLGDTRGGSPGLRMQTFHEPTFEFKVLVDAFAAYNYVELPVQPVVAIVAGPPVLYKAILPTVRRAGQTFSLGFKGEDKWGNPSHLVDGTFGLRANVPVAGLPASIEARRGGFAHRIGGLSVNATGELHVEVLDASGHTVCVSNPLRIVADSALLPYWADLHGQSEETIGTNSARELIEFARDRAFLDAMSHQGNDFQITTPFWEELNRLTAEYNRDGGFIIFPGYEWSGNTGLGGDRNVLFMREGRQIRRSHHALVEDLSDLATDANSSDDLFRVLKDEDCVVFAHIGGRYADIRMSHDARIERSVEVHSDWGTFEWLIEDALEQGYRVGIVANSDGHKGRHGASHPGASLFGAYGGLTCLLAPELSRRGLFDAMRRRHHYATTGCRMILDTRVAFDSDAELFEQDPNLGAIGSRRVRSAMMGDILRTGDREVSFEIDIVASAPIERVEIRNRLELVEMVRPFEAKELGRRIRLIWEGSEYRGRGRQSVWDGGAKLHGNTFERVSPINMWNLDKKIDRAAPDELKWTALTTGGFGGADIVLGDASSGTLSIATALVKAQVRIADIGREDIVLGSGGGIRRRMRLYRLPDENPAARMQLRRRIRLQDVRDNALYVCVTQEDGHLIWSSPIYVFR